MKTDDVVDPADAALDGLLAHLAESHADGARRDEILDVMLTAPPIAAWPKEVLQELYEVCSWVGVRHRLERGRAAIPKEMPTSDDLPGVSPETPQEDVQWREIQQRRRQS